MGEGPNQVGLSKLHIQDSVEDSLRRLDLSHIDMLYIHGVDPVTPIEETMRGLEDVVNQGKCDTSVSAIIRQDGYESE